MGDLSAMFGAPVEVEVAPGKVVKFSQLKFKVLTSFETWAKARHNEAVDAERRTRIAALDGCAGLAPFDRGRLILEIQSDSPKFDLATALNEVDGMMYVLWLSAREHQPSMTLDELGGLLPFSRQSVTALLSKLSPAGPETPEDVQQALIGDALGCLTIALTKPCGMAEGADLIQKAADVLKEVLGEKTGPPAPGLQSPSSR